MIVWKASLKSLPERIWELLWYLTAVILGLSVCVAALSLGNQFARTMDSMVRVGAADLNILPDGALIAPESAPNPSLLTEDTVVAIGEVPGVATAAGQVVGGLLVPLGTDGEPRPPGLMPQMTGDLVPGIGLQVTDGRAPLDADEVALDRSTMAAGGLAIGDVVAFAAPGGRSGFRATLVGTVAAEDAGAASLIMFDTAGARGAFLDGREGYNRIRITLAHDADADRVRDEVVRLIPEGYVLRTGAEVSRAIQWQLEPWITLAGYALLGAAALAALAALFLIGHTVAQLVDARREELARLRRLGASRLQLALPALAETLLLGVVGASAALWLGPAMAGGLSDLASRHGLPLGAGAHDLPGWEGWLVLAFGAVSPVLFARRRLAVATAARPRGRYEDTVPRLRFGDATWSSLGLVLIGGGLLVAGTTVPTMPAPLIWTTLGAVGLVAGTAVAAPVLGLLPAKLLGLAGHRVTGGMSSVAVARITRHPASFIKGAALLVLVTGVAAPVGVLSASGVASAERRIPQSLRGELFITSVAPGGFDVTVRSRARLVPGVRVVGSYGLMTAVGEGVALRTMVGDQGSLGQSLAVPVSEGRPPQALDEIMVEGQMAARLGIRRGGTLQLLINQQQVDARVVGIFRAVEGPDAVDVIALRRTFTSLGVPDNDALVSLGLTDSSKRAVLQAELTDLFAAEPLTLVRSADQLAADRGSLLVAVADAGRTLTWPLLAFCTVGLTGVLIGRLPRRRSEFHALRLVGADRSHITLLVAAESVILGISAALLGTVAGTLAGVGVRRALRSQGFSVLVIDWPTLFGLFAAGAVVGLVAALIPAFLAWRMAPHMPGTAAIGSTEPVYGGAHTGERQQGAESAGTSADPQT